MSQISVISKLTGVKTTTEGTQVSLNHSSIVKLHLERADIQHFARNNNDLVLTLHSGETIIIKNFYVTDAQGLSQLVLEDDNGALWWIEDPTAAAAHYESIASTDVLLAAAGGESTTGGAIWPWVLGGVAAAGGIALAAGGGGGGGGGGSGHSNSGSSDPADPADPPSPDKTAPVAPAISGVTDNVGTVQGALTSGQSTDDSRPTFSGTAEAGSTVTVYDNGTAIGSVAAGSDGKWSFTPSTDLSEGTHNITTQATDAAGNTGPGSSSFAVVVDTTPPDTPTLLSATERNGATATQIQSGHYTHTGTPEISGKGEPGDTITLYDQGVKIGEANVDSNGNWHFTPGSTLTEGTHSLTITETDPAGNTSGISRPLDFIVDNTPPGAPTDLAITPDGGALTGKAEAGSTIIVSNGTTIVGTAVTDAQGNFTVPLNPAQLNGETLSATATDAASNTSPPASLTAPDTTPPAIPTGVAVNHDGDHVTGKAEPGSTVTVKNEQGTLIGTGQADGSGNFDVTLSPPQKNGEVLDVTATDGANNTSQPALAIAPDTTAPGAPTDLAITADGSTLTGKAEAGSSIIISNGTTTVGTAVTDAQGNFTVQLHPAQLNGETLSATATDAASNTSPPASLTAPDTTPPAIPTNVVVNHDGDHVTGKAEPGSTVTVKDEQGSIIGTGQADGSGHFDVTLSTPQKNGEVLDVTATDGASNTSQPALAIAPDTTAPGAPTNLAITADGGTLTGKAEASSTITISNGTTVVGTAVTNDQGNFTVTLTPSQRNGETLSATATDEAGNTSTPGTLLAPDTTPAQTPEILGVVDNVADFTGNISNGGLTNDNHPTIYGKGEAGTTLSLYSNNTLIGTVVIQPDGSWSFPANAPLSEGGNVITAQAVDGKGQASSISAAWNVTVDTTLPDTPVLKNVLDDVAENTGPITSGQVTNDSTPTFSGTGEAGATLNVMEGGNVIGTANIDANGVWTWTPASGLSNGTHNLTFVAVDAAGNHSNPTSVFQVNLSTTAPGVPTIDSVTDDVGSTQGTVTSGKPTDDNRPLLEGTTTAGNTIAIYDGNTLLGNATVDLSGHWSFTPGIPLADGTHNITAVAINAAGNTATSAPFVVEVDTVAPTAPSTPVVTVNPDGVDVILSPGQPTRDTTPTLSGSGNVGDVITIYNGSTPLGTTTVDGTGHWSWTPNPPLPNGTYDISLTATDKDGAGNESAASQAATIIIDTSAPATPAAPVVTDNVDAHTGPVSNNGSTNDGRPVLSGSGEPGAVITLYDNVNGTKSVLGNVTVDPTGHWSFQPSTALSQGNHTFSTTAKDEAGNISTESPTITVNVDTVAPDQPSGLSINGQGTILSGTAEAGSTVEVRDASNTLIGTGTADVNNHFTVTLSSPQASGNNLSITAEDSAGNTSNATSWTVTGTVQPPVIDAILDDVGLIQGNVKGGISDDPLPTISGTAQAGSTVNLYQDGILLTTITLLPGETNWSFQLIVPLTPLAHSFTATATLGANTSASSDQASVTINLLTPGTPVIGAVTDDVAPYTGPLTNGQTTNDNTPTLSGTAGANNTVTIYDGLTKLADVVAGADGKWSYTPGTLSDGSHSLTITVTDITNIPSVPSEAFVVVVDTTPPAKPGIDTVTDDVPLLTGNVDKNTATNDTTPTLSGHAEAGSTVSIRDNGVEIGTVTAGAGGTWTFTPTKALNDGTHDFTVVATDSVGNQSVVSDDYSVTVATTPPAQPTLDTVYDDLPSGTGNLTNGQLTNDSTPTLNGTGVNGTTIHILDNGSPVGTAIVTNGTWSFTPTVPLGEGVHNLRVYASDNAGNTSTTTPAFAITVDATPPANPVVTGVLDDVGPVTGQIGAGGTTNDSKPTLSGTGEAGTTIHITDGGTEIGTAVVTAGGTWTFTPATALSEGTHNLVISATDPAGNSSLVNPTLTFTVDTVAPVAPLVISVADDVGTKQTPLSSGQSTDDTTPSFTGSTEPNALISVYDNGTLLTQIAADGTGAWTYTPPALSEGSHGFTFTATDAAGNVGPASTPFTVVVDTTKPSVPLITQAVDDVGTVQGTLSNGQSTDDTSPLLKGTSEPLATINVYDGLTLLGTTTANASGNWTYQVSSNLSETTHSFTVRASDAAGNLSDPSTPFTLTISTTPPAPPVITAVVDDVGSISGPLTNGQATNDNLPTLSGTAVAGSLVRIYDGTTLLGSVVATNGSWSFTPATALSDGPHALKATASDAVGNPSADSSVFNIVVDATAPNTPAITSILDNVGTLTGPVTSSVPTNDNTPELHGTAEANAVVRIYDGATPIGQVTADGSGNWTFTTGALSDGQHNFSVTATDAVGNTSAASTISAIVVDTVAPLAPGALAVVNVGTLVTGTAEAGSTVTITTSGGTVLGTATVDGSGHFSVTLSPAQTNGETLTAYATDKAGNLGASASITAPFTTLPNAPVIATVSDDVGTLKGTLSNGQTTDDTTPTLAGTAQPGSTVTLYNNGVLIGTTLADGSGNWSFTTPAMGEGSHAFTATATNGSGTGPVSAAMTVIVDTTAPNAPTGQFNADGSVLTGQAEAGSTVTIRLPDGTTYTATANASGSYSLAFVNKQTDGGTLTLTATDTAGNMSLPGQVLAPNLPLSAANNVDELNFTTTATVTDAQYSDYGVLLVGAVGNVLSLLGNNSAQVTFNVDNGASADITINAYGTGVVLGLLNSMQLVVQHWDATNNVWTTVVDTGNNSTLNLLTIGASGVSLNLTGLAEGQYRVLTYNTSLLATGSYSSLDVDVSQTSAGTIVGANLNVSGNVITDVDASAGSDNAPAGTLLTQVTNALGQATAINATGSTVVHGQYGDLTISADGSYTYTLTTTSATAYGRTENFTYTIMHNGVTASAQLVITLGSSAQNTHAIAVDDSSTFTFDTSVHAVDNGTSSQGGFTVVGIGLGNVLTLDVLSDLSNPIIYNVDQGTTRTMTLQASVGGVAIGSVFDLYVYKFNTATQTYQQYRYEKSWLTAPLLGGASGKLTVDLPAGQYLFLLNTASGITALTGYTLNVLEDHVYAVSSTGGSTTGNVMADDILPTSVTATVTDVNGVHVNASGLTTIQGLYGTLSIDAQGNYTYTLNSGVGADKISTPDTFVYTLTDSTGHKDSASLNITPTPHALDAINDVSKVMTFDTAQHTVAWSDTSVGSTNWTTALLKSTSGTGSGTFIVDQNTALHDIVLHFNISSLLPLGGLAVSWSITLQGASTPIISDSFTGGSTTINLSSLDLDAGTYTLSFTGTAGPLSIGGITITPSVTGTSVFLNNDETTSGHSVIGNIFDGTDSQGALDQLASVDTRLSITGYDGHVSTLDPYTTSNATATVVGHYGTLSVGVDGSYTYTLNSGISLATMTSKEVFNYTLTAANGQTDSASLTINLSPQMISTNHNDTLTGSVYGDTLIYHVLDTTVGAATGGNGTGDHWTNFSVSQGDKIDISDLLVGWNGQSSTLGNYLHVTTSGSNTVISIDRDGAGSTYANTTLVTLDNVQTSYDELVNQHHNIIT